MVNAVNQYELNKAKKRQADINLEEANRAKIGAEPMKASKASQELAKIGALKSGDPTAIAQAKGAVLPTQPQVNVADFQANKNQTTQAIQGIGQLTPEQQQRIDTASVDTNPVNVLQALAAGGVGAAAGSGTGAAIGALAAPFTAGLSVPAGAVIGGVFGFVGGVYTKISIDKRQDVKKAFVLSNEAAGNMDWVISQVNSGRMSPGVASALFNEDKVNFYVGQANLKSLTDSDLDEFLSGGVDELTKIKEFESRIPQMELNLALASQQPNQALVQTQTSQTDSFNQ